MCEPSNLDKILHTELRFSGNPCCTLPLVMQRGQMMAEARIDTFYLGVIIDSNRVTVMWESLRVDSVEQC